MKKKVTLRELVATKIVYALLLVTYYWMWARRDWHDYYSWIQYAVAAFTIVFFLLQSDRVRKYKKEESDELSELNLKKVDVICFKIAIALLIGAAFLGAAEVVSGIVLGYIIMFLVLGISIVRTILFYLMDVKGIGV